MSAVSCSFELTELECPMVARTQRSKKSLGYDAGSTAMERVVGGHRITFDLATSERMKRVRRAATKPEVAVRHVVSGAGQRFRLTNRDLPGSPDLANRRGKWAVFVNGCYWHRHARCVKATTPTRNREFWKAKFKANMARDARAVSALRASGFRVLTIWECEADFPDLLAKIVASFFKRTRRSTT